MLPFVTSKYHEVADEGSSSTIPNFNVQIDHGVVSSSSKIKMATTSSNSTDFSSTSAGRSISPAIQSVMKSRLAWIILLLSVILLILTYEHYLENLRRNRFASYQERAEELEMKLRELKVQYSSASTKLMEIIKSSQIPFT